MSRSLTSTQVIERGEYLNSDFDPSSLTIPHLLSILTFHAVKYPTPYNKGKLVQAFNDEIRPHVNQFKKERLQREGSVPSSHGITDGITGQSISDDEPPMEQVPLRRASRRLPRLSSQAVPPTTTETMKRRRSSAGPSVSRVTAPLFIEPEEPDLIEENEHLDEPARKVGRPRKSAAAAGPQARRVSQAEEAEGWSDNNVFQSGAESSSPVRDSPSGRGSGPVRRSTRRVRTSFSAPPSSSPFAPLPSSSTFDPRLPVEASMRSRNIRVVHGPEATYDVPGVASRRVISRMKGRTSSPVLEEEQEDQEDQGDQGESHSDDVLEDGTSDNAEISSAIANHGSAQVVARRTIPKPRGVFPWPWILFALIGFGLTGITVSYKVNSTAIGYCTPGTNTNAILGERQALRAAARECTTRLAHHSGTNITCTPLPLLPLPEPTTCTPCPAHAYCTPDTVTCETSFVLRQHPLAMIPFLSQLLDGMPGFGPVAFPPSCLEDEARKRNTGRLGVALENYLALVRGQKLCSGAVGDSSDDAAHWGLDVEQVHDQLRKVTTIQRKVVKPDEFESLFEQAIADLQKFGYVTIGRDASGIKHIAAVRTHLDFPCKIRVGVRNAWDEWKVHVFASAFLVIIAYWIKGKIVARRLESRRVADLVHVVLNTLRNHEFAHYTDPVTTPQASLSSLHLRDLILQNELSIPVRRRLWDKVQKIVEGNTNVRASMEELEGGDEGRVWRWVGGPHKNSIKS